jgi:hypothetical protein
MRTIFTYRASENNTLVPDCDKNYFKLLFLDKLNNLIFLKSMCLQYFVKKTAASPPKEGE